MSTPPFSLELIPIETGSDVTPAVEPIDASRQAASELTLILPTPMGLALEAQDAPAGAAEEMPDLEIDVAPIASPMTDRHLIAATTEFEKGEIDQPLWDRAFALAKGDRKSTIATYLPARATALRLLNRDKPPVRSASARSAEPRITGQPLKPSASKSRDDGDETSPSDFRSARYKSYGIKAAATLCAGIVVLAFVTYVYPGSDASSANAMASTGPARAKPKAPALPDPKASAQVKAAEEETRLANTQKLIAKVEEFRAVDNWNLLVLYTTEWTRQEPGNAAAWSQLSQGFERLHQFSEAREAATTAAKLAPKEARYWRNLGDLDVELSRPEDALKAFEVATGLDENDVHSIVQVGLLNVALSHLAEAKVASSRALALHPEDPRALCLKALIVSSQAPPKVPTAATRQSANDGGCRNVASSADAAVIANNVKAAGTAPASATR